MEDQYLELEEFFGPVHDLAIKKGIQDLQAVFKVVSTSDDGDNVANSGTLLVLYILSLP